jgi:hypothetical protein
MISYGGLFLDVHRFAEMFMLGTDSKVGIWESCSPPIMYARLKERVGQLTLLTPDTSIELSKNLKLLTFDEATKKKQKPENDMWIVFDPDNIGMPMFLPKLSKGSLKRGGRVVLIKRKTLVPTIQMSTLTAMFVSEGLKHVGSLDLNPQLACDVFYKEKSR